MYSHNKVSITLKANTKVTDNIFPKNNSDKKICVHNACAKRKRYYDVTLSRQEGSMMRHLANAQWDQPGRAKTRQTLEAG